MQFQKASNLYFLLVTYMQTIKVISISGGKPAMAVPLFFVVLVSMIKDLFEDFKRHQADDRENNAETMVYDPKSKGFKQSKWRQIHCG